MQCTGLLPRAASSHIWAEGENSAPCHAVTVLILVKRDDDASINNTVFISAMRYQLLYVFYTFWSACPEFPCRLAIFTALSCVNISTSTFSSGIVFIYLSRIFMSVSSVCWPKHPVPHNCCSEITNTPVHCVGRGVNLTVVTSHRALKTVCWLSFRLHCRPIDGPLTSRTGACLLTVSLLQTSVWRGFPVCGSSWIGLFLRKIHGILWDSKVHCRTHNCSPLVPILSQMEAFHTLPS